MAILPRITSPADVRALRPAQLKELAREIRHFLVDAVSRTGGRATCRSWGQWNK